MKYKDIAVIYGSDSSEWEVSCRSGAFVSDSIEGYNVYEIFARFGAWILKAYRMAGESRCELKYPRPIDKNDFSVMIDGKKVKFEYAYIIQHGTPGENGLMQGYLDMIGVPYSSCNAFVSAITFDKYSCKNYLRDLDYVRLADDVFIRKGDDVQAARIKAEQRFGYPMFVKPTDGGSSFGVTKVKKAEDFAEAVSLAFSEGKTVIAEGAIVGRELTDAVYFDGKDHVALPVIEIITENEFFDYEAKYNGHSKEVCPAEIPDEVAAMIQDVSKRLYVHLGCSGVVRMDYILSEEGLYFLEINTIPGMTSASLVPQMVRAAGIQIQDFLGSIIENS